MHAYIYIYTHTHTHIYIYIYNMISPEAKDQIHLLAVHLRWLLRFICPFGKLHRHCRSWHVTGSETKYQLTTQLTEYSSDYS